MIKNSKSNRIFSCLLSLSLLTYLLFIISPTSVHAIDTEQAVTLATISGQQASNDLKQYLVSNDISVKPTDEISLINDGNIKLQVISQESEDTYTVSVISGYNQQGTQITKSDVPFVPNLSRSSPSFSYNYKNNTITFTASVTYDSEYLNIDGYDRIAYRPLSTSFRYTRSSSATVTITKVESTFRTGGALYQVSTGSILNDDYYYDITNNISSPNPSINYSKSRELSNYLRIIFASGADDEGPLLSYAIYYSDGTSNTMDSINMR